MKTIVRKTFSDGFRKTTRQMVALADYGDDALKAAGFKPDMEVTEQVPETKAEEAKEMEKPSMSSETRALLESIKANEDIAKEDKSKIDKAVASLDEADKIIADVQKMVDELSKKYPSANAAEEAAESPAEEAAENAIGTEIKA